MKKNKREHRRDTKYLDRERKSYPNAMLPFPAHQFTINCILVASLKRTLKQV